MIPKASQRKGGQNLVTHLLNEFDNERVHVYDVRGATASDLHRAFAEWEAVATATKCRKYVYSQSINPDPDQRAVTREEYYAYIARVEKALGLAAQPRAVIFHVSTGATMPTSSGRASMARPSKPCTWRMTARNSAR